MSSDTTPQVATPRDETEEERIERYFTLPDAKKHKDDTNSIKRLKYLLSLTDLFRHFINKRMEGDPKFRKLVNELDRASKAQKKTRGRGGRGRRKTEKEEDEELLNDNTQMATVYTESPPFINGTLREYQVQGLNWLISLHENSISGILADEMGLGKTLQTISFLGYLRYKCGINGPHIVIVPKSTLDNWRREFEKWTPEVKTVVLRGDKTERAEIIANEVLTADFDVVISSFEIVIREKSALKKVAWEYIIVDEAHRIKNEDSMLSQIIRLFHSTNRLLITGTPLQNNLHELWALLNFLLPDIFSEAETFDQWFEEKEAEGEEGENDEDSVVKQLHKVLRPFLLRRVKNDVEKSLLPKKELNLYIGMSDMQVQWYQKLLEKDIDAVNGQLGKREGKTRLLNIVMQLRKCCNHPYLFEGAEPGPPYTTDEHLVFNCGKMVMLDKLLKRLKSQGSRVLIFSQMSRMLDILEDYCSFRDYEYSRIDGSTAHEDRIAAIDEYNAEGSEKFVFLLTTRAGGLGINLTSADIVILYDSDWNPQADLQAMDRAHRIGQTKQVYVFRFVTENAVEEKVLERAAQKLRLDQLVIQQGRTQQKAAANNSESKGDLLSMIRHGTEDIFKSSKGTLKTEDDIEAILLHGEKRTKQLNDKFAELGIDDLQKFSTDSAMVWNGEDFQHRVGANGIGAPDPNGKGWINPPKRERREQHYGVNSYYKDIFLLQQQQPRTMRPPKQVPLAEHQFFPPGLKALQDQELAFYRKQINYKVPYADIDVDALEEGETKESKRAALNKEIADAEPLTEEQEALKRDYESEGFTNWTKRDMNNLVHLIGRHGRDNMEAVARAFRGKGEEEVLRYAKTFMERHTEVEGYEKYIAVIEQGEEKLKRQRQQQELIKTKLKECKVPMNELPIVYPANNSKRVYSEEEDRFILMMVNKYGLEHPKLFEKIRKEIKKSPHFRFDWFFLSRSTSELSRRCTTLMLTLSREVEGPRTIKRKSLGKGKLDDDKRRRESGTMTPDTEDRGTPMSVE
ncbi:SNF2 family N-terminal domain-domain-containing protein [Yarrowia lipolytica]|uniref:SNF2 family N-terminal domain-domain-containing protein n=1 Tax=Yarrowia lipolytica TaxID=4952 RepID=A0A371BYZ1_YARLL|nr:SNF2 family N-terminal domain-containing protein [Yarrowia lipolytica]KAE8170478.1 SNF2 family N-terminal domain-containing protein [Yarrowia lipolytica]QNP98566.1 ISWI chromatin-remodeling complex ATPase ISW2 [Yarrowia lipolytica]RDW23313.1 SNF2 family N-terminal domain-domain-containing protein [Yarrowia lipolytica]RDW29838.1 SNF2 family N-terminal domain-domain-containing protein [Yarrowia lipolytica]